MKLSFLLNNQQVKFFLPKFISVFFRAVPLTILGFSVIEGSLLTSKTLAQTATTTEVSFRYSGYITLNASYVLANTNTIRAFVETGSSSPYILATIGESTNMIPSIAKEIFCGPRTYNGKQGVLITIVLNQAMPSNGTFSLTLVQSDATNYQPPILYIGN
jgi:hypothetical protein